MFKNYPVIFAVLIMSFIMQPAFGDSDLTAQEIINTMTETMNPEQSEGVMKMITETSSGEERTFIYKTYSKNKGEKSLMKYLEPSRVKGQTILMLNDGNDIWTYFPKKNHVRKLATHAKKQKVEGSDFSYEDMGGSNTFIEQYESNRLKDEKKESRLCYKIQLTRKENSDASYSKLVIWVDQETLVPLVIDYYHEKDPNLREKQLICTDIQIIDGINTPMKYTMYNKLNDNKTLMEIIDVKYDVNIPNNIFTEEGMKQ